MPVVVVEDEGPDLQGAGGVGRRHQRRHRGQLVAEVVGHEQGGEAQILDLPGLLGPGRPRVPRGRVDNWAAKRKRRGWAMAF